MISFALTSEQEMLVDMLVSFSRDKLAPRARDADETAAESILAFAKDRLVGFMRPRSVDFVDQIPRSETGKVLRRRIRERYLD